MVEQLSLCDLAGWSGRMCQEPSVATAEKTSKPSLRKSSGSSSRNAPMCLCLKTADGAKQDACMTNWADGALLGGYTMHSFGESPREENESRLSQILEECVPQKYYLSARACQGILNRAKRRGKDLPSELKAALEVQAYPSKTEPATQGGAKEYCSNTIEQEPYHPSITKVFSIQGGGATSMGSQGSLINEDVSFTLNSVDNHAVCCATDDKIMCLNDQGGGVMNVSELSATLRVNSNGHEPIIFSQNQRDEVRDLNDCAASLMAEPGMKQQTFVCAGFKHGNGAKARGIGYEVELSPTLSAMGNEAVFDARGNGTGVTAPTITGDHENRVTDYTAICLDDGFYSAYKECAPTQMARNYKNPPCVKTYNQQRVRRLTPTECERLQGFPDSWTDIGEWVDGKGKKRELTDSSRYKALGNSIALPFWAYLLRRISAQYERKATMGSLFDGIGGFPLCWERCNGKGTAIWASEIEEFPIAVTKRHFPKEGGEDNV